MDENSELYIENIVEEEDTGNPLMENPFNPSLVKIDTKSPTISLLIDRLKQDPKEIDLYPDFQRSDNLWNVQKQSQLIESILVKLPLPAFYFDGTDDSKWLVVDGLQRLSTLRNFIIDKTLILSDLEFLKNLENTGFDDLPRTLQREILQTQIVAYVIQPGTPLNVKFNLFKRINTGGLVLEPQEIRHALNQGKPSRFIAELAQLQEFKIATGNKISSLRMLDREFVTRFFAFYSNKIENYTPDLDSFLNKSMATINELQDSELNQIRNNFIKSMELSFFIFDDWAFRKMNDYPTKRKPINKALFEVWSVNLAKLENAKRETIKLKKNEILTKFSELSKNDIIFQNAITSGTGEKQKVIYRFQVIENLLKEILQC